MHNCSVCIRCHSFPCFADVLHKRGSRPWLILIGGGLFFECVYGYIGKPPRWVCNLKVWGESGDVVSVCACDIVQCLSTGLYFWLNNPSNSLSIFSYPPHNNMNKQNSCTVHAYTKIYTNLMIRKNCKKYKQSWRFNCQIWTRHTLSSSRPCQMWSRSR